MKKIILVVVLIGIAGIAGLVRSHTLAVGGKWPVAINSQNPSAGEAREDIRKSYELSPGARVEVSGINGAVKIETSDSKTADVHIERTGASQEMLNRRKITIDYTTSGLTIRGEKSDTGLLSRLFGASPAERVTLRLPRQVSVVAKGVNGSVIVGQIEGSVEVHGVNGKVEIDQASGSADFNGINGNIELRLGEGVNADLETHGMNGNVTSDLPNVVVDKSKRGSYSAQIGSGGNAISANGINGNIRLKRLASVEPIGDR